MGNWWQMQQILTSETHFAQLYVKQYFPEAAKNGCWNWWTTSEGFEARINRFEWMSDSTKRKAKEKLYAISKKIGYPDKWRDYDKVNIARSTYFENIVSANANIFQFQLAKLNKPVDKTGSLQRQRLPLIITFANEIVFRQVFYKHRILTKPQMMPSIMAGLAWWSAMRCRTPLMTRGRNSTRTGMSQTGGHPDDYARFKAKTQRVIELYSSLPRLTAHM